MKNIDFLCKNYIAHRGLHDKHVPENSLLAFQNAVIKGYAIELDVHLTKDGKVVVFHDDSLERMTGIKKKIKSLTYKELKNIPLKNTKHHIPLLSEVLSLVDGKVPLLVELKYDNKVGLLEDECIKILDDYKGDFALQSFNIFAIRYLKKLRNNYLVGLLISSAHRRTSLKRNIYDRCTRLFFKPDFLSCDIRFFPSNKFQKYRKKGMILGWTVRSSLEQTVAIKYCDNLICENILK